MNNFQVGIGNRTIDTFIVSDGITELNNSIFNSCKVSKIYLPKSLSIIYDDTLAYLGEDKIDVYYEGTEDEWNNMFTEYQAKSASEEWSNGNAEESGKALADKLNSSIGHEYDSSKFTFHYESDITDIN